MANACRLWNMPRMLAPMSFSSLLGVLVAKHYDGDASIPVEEVEDLLPLLGQVDFEYDITRRLWHVVALDRQGGVLRFKAPRFRIRWRARKQHIDDSL